jgi:hypothetical protein
VQARTRGARRRALATLRRTVGLVRAVIRQNRLLAQAPGHEASAGRRIREGEVELERLTEEIRVLEAEVERDAAGLGRGAKGR